MKQLRFLLVFSLLAVAALAQSDVEQNLRRHVEYLASEKLEGRRTGEQGATFAAGYVANQFAKAKLKPGFRSNGSKPNFLQPFPYVSGVTLGTDNFLRLIPSDPKNENKMEIGVNWMPLGYSMSADVAPADLVFVGFGVTAPEANYDDYKGVDVQGKIVLMFDSTPDAGNPHSPFVRFNIHTKANIAKDKGAKAIVLIAADSDFKNDRLSKLSYDRTLGETALPVVGIMRSQGAELFGAADDKALATIEKAGSSAGIPKVGIAQLKVNLAKKTVEAYNVIGIIEGHDPQLKNEAIIIGAHYDHLGRGGTGSRAANSADIHYGADDNASGTSAILELARQFAAEKKNKRTLIFMAFGGEEEGLLGSKYYVNNPVWPLDRTIAMINLDMVGRLNENKLTVGGIGTASEWRNIAEGLSQKRGSENTDLVNRVVDALRKNGIETVSVSAKDGGITLEGTVPEEKYSLAVRTAVDTVGTGVPVVNHLMKSSHTTRFFDFQLSLNEDGFGPSDHSSFYGKNIPVLFFFTGTHADYHLPSDTFEKINYEGLTRITNYVAEITRAVDNNPIKPTYAAAKSSGPMGQVRMSVSLGTIPSYADSTDGMALDGVRENSPAAKAGLKAGDKVLKLAGKDVRNAMDYTYVLGSMKAGEEYEIVIKRGEEEMTLKIVPAPAARRP